MKENSLLATGAENTRPDYDYEKGLTLTWYQPSEGKEACCAVPNLNGQIVNRAQAALQDGKAVICLEKAAAAEIAVRVVCDGKVVEGKIPEGTKKAEIICG